MRRRSADKGLIRKEIYYLLFMRRADNSRIPRTRKGISAPRVISGGYCRVFADDPELQAQLRAWGAEEVRHGLALRKWVELADPRFVHSRRALLHDRQREKEFDHQCVHEVDKKSTDQRDDEKGSG